MLRRRARSTPLYSSAASDVYKRQAFYFHGLRISKHRAIARNPIKQRFFAALAVRPPRQLMPPTAEFSARHMLICPHCPRALRVLREAIPYARKWFSEKSAHVSAIWVTPPGDRAVDPGFRFRQIGRRGPRRRCGRRRLDSPRRDGRTFRPQHLLRPGCHQGDAPAQQEDLRRASDDFALAKASR